MKRRNRGSNFTREEIRVLLTLCKKHTSILGSNKKDSATWRAKDAAWREMAVAFNRHFRTKTKGQLFVPRSTKQLRQKYETLKKDVRKAARHQKTMETNDSTPPANITPLLLLHENELKDDESEDSDSRQEEPLLPEEKELAQMLGINLDHLPALSSDSNLNDEIENVRCEARSRFEAARRASYEEVGRTSSEETRSQSEERLSMEAKRRTRGNNFSKLETKMLLALCKEHASILESNRKDAASWREKDTAWREISSRFNQRFQLKRSMTQLRQKYDAVKRDIRRKSASHQQSVPKTNSETCITPLILLQEEDEELEEELLDEKDLEDALDVSENCVPPDCSYIENRDDSSDEKATSGEDTRTSFEDAIFISTTSEEQKRSKVTQETEMTDVECLQENVHSLRTDLNSVKTDLHSLQVRHLQLQIEKENLQIEKEKLQIQLLKLTELHSLQVRHLQLKMERENLQIEREKLQIQMLKKQLGENNVKK